jgi:glyoxylate/hydroxypyruvate reductase A
VEVFAGAEGLQAFLAGADMVVNLLPLTPETRGILSAPAFAAMKPGAALINVARGGHMVTADVIAALDSGRLGHAVLDVFEQEPLPADSPLWAHPKVTAWPHVAARTYPETAAFRIAANINRFRSGETVEGLVDRARGY